MADQFTTDPDTAEMAICLREGMPAIFTDNKIGSCCECNHPVIYRPTVPDSMLKICVICYGGGPALIAFAGQRRPQ